MPSRKIVLPAQVLPQYQCEWRSQIQEQLLFNAVEQGKMLGSVQAWCKQVLQGLQYCWIWPIFLIQDWIVLPTWLSQSFIPSQRRLRLFEESESEILALFNLMGILVLTSAGWVSPRVSQVSEILSAFVIPCVRCKTLFSLSAQVEGTCLDYFNWQMHFSSICGRNSSVHEVPG